MLQRRRSRRNDGTGRTITIVVALAAARQGDAHCLFRHLHFFPFGSFDATVAWAAAIARGDFSLSHDRRDITV